MEKTLNCAEVDGAVLLTAESLAAEVPNTAGNANKRLELLFAGVVMSDIPEATEDIKVDKMTVVCWFQRMLDL